MKNKSYNAFKMWGSWVGLVVGFFSVMFMGPEGIPLDEFLYVYTNSIAIIFPIIGFFLGWGIHSLVRRFRK